MKNDNHYHLGEQATKWKNYHEISASKWWKTYWFLFLQGKLLEKVIKLPFFSISNVFNSLIKFLTVFHCVSDQFFFRSLIHYQCKFNKLYKAKHILRINEKNVKLSIHTRRSTVTMDSFDSFCFLIIIK